MGLLVHALDSSLLFSNDNLRISPISHSNLRFAGHQFNFKEKHHKVRIATSSFTCFSAKLAHEDKSESVVVKEKSVSVILLARGKGKRMGVSPLRHFHQAYVNPFEDVTGVQILSDRLVHDLIYHVELAKGCYKDNAAALARNCIL